MSANNPPVSRNQTLGQAVSAYVANAEFEDRGVTSRELSRFSRWLGTDTPVAEITPEQVYLYRDQFSASRADLNRRLAPVKAFLRNLSTQHATDVNLGASVRLQRPPVRRRVDGAKSEAPEEVLVTEQGFAALSEELVELEERVRPAVTEQLRSAAADKDFRENAPYSAAKQRLSEVQSRINGVRATLAASSVYAGDSTEKVDLGATVTVHSLIEDEQVVYRIVGFGEKGVRDGGISIQSPLGKALMERRVGEVIEVQTPMGPRGYRIEKIERL